MLNTLCNMLGVDNDFFPELNDYSAPPELLMRVATDVLTNKRKNIVECGCGISTLVIARCLQINGNGGSLISLEHDTGYADETNRMLYSRNLNPYTSIHVSKLSGTPPWYSDIPSLERIDLLLVDGPPAKINQFSRYGAKSLFAMISPSGMIIIDDANRDWHIIDRWKHECVGYEWKSNDSGRGIAMARRRVSILIAVPNDDGRIHKMVFFSLAEMLMDGRYKCRVILPTHSPSDNNRHHIFDEFLRDGHDYLIMIDSDNPPAGNTLDLIDLDLDVIGCPTPVWHYTDNIPGERPVYENVYKYIAEKDAYTEWPTKNGLQKVDAVGTGCIVIAKRVLAHDNMQGANQRSLNANGTTNKGGDIMFCERARANGFSVYAHYDYRCRHFCNLELHEVMKAFSGLNLKG